MARQPRITLAGLTIHVVQRGNDRSRTFFDDDDFRTYLLLLRCISRRYQTSVHAYVLMTNHVHLLVTSKIEGGVSLTMQQTGSSYARYINRRYERTGTLWEGRFWSAPIETDFYCLACYRYIELNPVRAGIVARPVDYRWSSHRENSGCRTLSIVEPHPTFTAIGATRKQRVDGYLALFDGTLAQTTVDAIRRGIRTGIPVGDESFRQSLEVKTGRSIGPRKRGRPRKYAKSRPSAELPGLTDRER
jgi:REP-associated tyrosine transposase